MASEPALENPQPPQTELGSLCHLRQKSLSLTSSKNNVEHSLLYRSNLFDSVPIALSTRLEPPSGIALKC
ncbi:hypothetical protein PGT21_029119 [Puccinia graminis f. sp. tritici]|uniref:Uncharacterized protein n=1 Tax=Puccinia graminis f. sp. tritici TaxID=56615 RepID=A0A5B0P0P1_PUCGR|nr:hypothetical protein PGT21_029119 [Puccinia graminis f. sp. tritici]